LSVDRQAEGYQPNWDIDLAVGKAGEAQVIDTIDAWTHGRIEVKTDARAAQTGNLFVEFECKGRPSGIMVTKADSWAFVLGHAIIIIPTGLLRSVCTGGLRWVSMPRGSHPTRGYLLPIKDIPTLFRLG
jgi:hypothetical protein